MNDAILQSPEMALRLAAILLIELRGADELQWFEPLKVEDKGDVWFVSGNGDDTRRPDPLDDLEKETFYMHVSKSDAEVKDFGVKARMKLLPEVVAQIRSLLGAEGRAHPVPGAEESREYLPDISVLEMLHGGIINSVDASISFGRLVFQYYPISTAFDVQGMHADLRNGIWHIHGRIGAQNAELVFRRLNAQVISFDIRPAE